MKPTPLMQYRSAMTRLLSLPYGFVLAGLVSSIGGCAPQLSVGTPCERNSECIEPLACVEGRCGSECALHRDCIMGARCVVVAEGVGRCFVDAAPQCGDDDPCDFEGLTCLNRRCYADCANCPSDGVCVEGLCYRRDADAGEPAGDAALDAGVDASIPNREACDPLVSTSCTDGERCEIAYSANAVCRPPCTAHAECGAPNRCVRTNEGSSRQCTVACDPITSAGCLGSDSCDHLYFQAEMDEYLEAWECRRVGSAEMGESCRTDQPTDCGSGLTCSGESGGAYCRPLCDTDDDTCPEGFGCRSLDAAPTIGGRLFGVCTPF